MERNTFRLLVEAVDATRGSSHRPSKASYSDREVILVYFWAVLHDRPVSWACRRENWPWHDRCRALPSGATMSRRLRSGGVERLIAQLEARVLRPRGPGAFCCIDAKPLLIGGNSGDRDARFGRAAGSMAKGYKLHAVLDSTGQTLAWEVQPMNVDERPTAIELLRRVPPMPGRMLLADSNYDATSLYEAAAQLGLQLVAPARFKNAGRGHRPQSPHRLRGVRIAEARPELMRLRGMIERYFGTLGNRPGGLAPLPNWVRGMPRVRRWVAAKLIIAALQTKSRHQIPAA